jgi:hypothetical protein
MRELKVAHFMKVIVTVTDIIFKPFFVMRELKVAHFMKVIVTVTVIIFK